jgi:hypothetical protein
VKFGSDKSHVRRLTRKDLAPKSEGGMFTVAEKRRMKITSQKEQYIVTKDYRDPFEGKVYHSGQVISNRQGRNVQIQEQGAYQSYSQYTSVWSPKARVGKPEDKTLVRTRDSWIRRAAMKTGRTPNSIRQDPEFRQAFTQHHVINKGKKDTSPTGSLARILVAAGLRDKNAKYNVGDTPKDKRKKK